MGELVLILSALLVLFRRMILIYYRQVYTRAPQVLEVPHDLQDRPVEVIILSLDVQATEQPIPEVDEHGWSADFFAATAGQWTGEPLVREQPTEYETRLDLP